MLPDHIKLNSDGERGFFIDLRTGELYSLNPVGLRILQCLESDMPEDQVTDIIVAEFDVEKARAENDLRSFLDRFNALETLQ